MLPCCHIFIIYEKSYILNIGSGCFERQTEVAPGFKINLVKVILNIGRGWVGHQTQVALLALTIRMIFSLDDGLRFGLGWPNECFN